MEHHWPGNIRELRNIIERAVILGSGNRARLDLAMPDQSAAITPADTTEVMPPDETGFLTEAQMRERERANLIGALRFADWRVWGPDGAAVLLGIKPSTLAYRMKILGIKRPVER